MNDTSQTKQLRSFGLLVGGIFVLMGFWPLIFRKEDLRLWAVILGGLLVVLGVTLPRSLGPTYRVWMAVGQVLGWINTRIILGLIFYGVLTPMGLVRRLFLSKDAMRHKFEPDADTYRVIRQPRSRSHMTRQF